MARQIIHTDKAPKAIGTYSQAVKCGTTVYCSGQIPLDPATMNLVEIGNYSVPANQSRYPHFVNFVAQQLQENYGLADI